MSKRSWRAGGRAPAFPIIAVLTVALAIWLLEGRPGLPGGGGTSSQVVLTSPQGGQYVAIDAGPLGDSSGPRVGEPAPDFVLPDLEGRPVHLSSLRGRVVLVNFWATWCVPCRKEIPGLVRSYREHRREGFEIVAVSLQEPPNQVRSFVREWGMDYIVVIDRDGSVARQYRLTGAR